MNRDPHDRPRTDDNDPARHFDDGEWALRLDGVEPGPERRRHLAACPACAAEERRWMALSGALKGIPRQDLPPGLSTRILAAISESSSTKAGFASGGGSSLPEWLTWWGRPLGLAAAAVLLFVTVFTSQVLRAELEEWPSDGAWLVGLPAPEDPLDVEWNSEAAVESIEGLEGATPEMPARDDGSGMGTGS